MLNNSNHSFIAFTNFPPAGIQTRFIRMHCQCATHWTKVSHLSPLMSKVYYHCIFSKANFSTSSGRQRWLEATAPPASSNPEETLYEQWDCPQVSVNHTYTAQQPDELNLQPGDVINVLRKMSDGEF